MSTGSNTEILIKRSLSTSAPATLNQGELAYSYSSNTLFIGTPGSDGAIEVGHYSNLTNLTAGTYGDTTNIPIITVDGHGTVTNVTTSTISTTLTINADSGGPNNVSLINDTIEYYGGDGVTTAINRDTAGVANVTFDVDDTVFRSNTAMFSQYIDSNVEISGNLHVLGDTTQIDVVTLNIADPLIYLASNNYTSDIVDIGFAGNYYDSGTNTQRHAGVMRHAGDKDFYIFYNYDKEPTDNVINTNDASFLVANTHTNVIGNLTGNVDATLVQSNAFLAAEGAPDGYGNAGYSFKNDGGYDTGMFSPSDGELQFYSNADQIFTANNSIIDFKRDLKLQNSGLINNPSGLLELNPNETNNDDRYIVIDPTAPNHIHLRAGGNIDDSTADLFLGGEQNYVRVSDASFNVEIRTNESYAWQFTNQGKLQLANGTSIYDNTDGNYGFYVDPIRANNATGGNVTVYNTTTKEVVSTNVTINNSGITLANGTVISGGESGLFVDSLNAAQTSNIVFYNTDTKELTYGAMADLRPDRIQNGSYYWEVDVSTGALFSDAGTHIADNANSVIIGQNVDLTNTNTNRVAIGNGAGQTGQNYGSTAIGEGAGNSNQAAWAVALGLNAGNSSQGNSTVAVGHSAGRTNQGSDSVAIGVSAGETNQGQYTVAIGERAGYGASSGQGEYSVMIGSRAGYSSAAVNSIVLNASGSELNSSESGLYINPIRYTETQDNTYDGLMFYNANTKEVRYSYTLDGGSF